MTVHVVAHFRFQPGRAAEAAALMDRAVEATAAEDGCEYYRYGQDNDNPDHLVFLEEWRDHASLEAHLDSAHVQSMVTAAEPLLAEPISVARLTLR